MAKLLYRYKVGVIALGALATAAGAAMFFGARVMAAGGGEETKLPAYVVEWKQFAEQSGRPEDKKWVELISDPQAVKLEQDWKKWRGYDMPELVAKARAAGEIPPELKPGLVITKDNYKSFPWLSKFMPEAELERVADPNWFRFKSIRIVPTSSYYYSRARLEGQYAEKGQFELDYTTGALKIKNCTTCEPGKVIPETWGAKSLKFPFAPHPKDGLELAWYFILDNVASDNLFFKPIDFILISADNRIERTYSADLWWKNFWGRASYPPVPFVPGTPADNYQGGAIFFLHPLDVKGLCGVRIRHFDPTQDDSFWIFLPTLRRTRVLAGSDTQDPLCPGCELTWDDWRAYWTRMDARSFDFKLAGEQFVLVPPKSGFVGDHWRMDSDNNLVDVDMELVPTWVLIVTDKSGKYEYKTSKIWVEKDWWYIAEIDRYDQQDRPWRIWIDVRYWDPRTGENLWRNCLLWDKVNRHVTILRMNANLDQAKFGTKQEYFDIDTLRTYK